MSDDILNKKISPYEKTSLGYLRENSYNEDEKPKSPKNKKKKI